MMRNPDITGYAKAWVVNWEKVRDLQQATLKCYLIEGGFHPFWNQWCLSLIHLRDIPGFGPAKKIRAEYTHELVIISANPKVRLDPDVRPTAPGWALMPPDVFEQFEVLSDADAVNILGKVVSLICNGEASPDSDFRSAWSRLIQAEAKKA